MNKKEVKHYPKPILFRVIVEVEKVKETFNKDGRIIMSQAALDKEERACMIGRVLELGPLAYSGRLDAGLPDGPEVKVGDRVTFVRYAGHRAEDGPEGQHYRTINDEDIINILRQENEENE